MKGQVIQAVGIVFTFIALFGLTTILATRYRINLEINYDYKYNSAQLALLTLLSSTSNKVSISKILSDGNYSQIKPIVKDKLDKIITSRCYTLNMSKLVVQGIDPLCKKSYVATTKIVLPYNPKNMTATVSLAIG